MLHNVNKYNVTWGSAFTKEFNNLDIEKAISKHKIFVRDLSKIFAYCNID